MAREPAPIRRLPLSRGVVDRHASILRFSSPTRDDLLSDARMRVAPGQGTPPLPRVDARLAPAKLHAATDCCTVPHVNNEFEGTTQSAYDEVTTDANGTTVHYHSIAYYTPKNDETLARKIAGDVRVSMPFYLPWSEPDVGLSGGWYYTLGTDKKSRSMHAACDIGRTNVGDADPSFDVHAVADGRVVSIFWDNRVGNGLVLEHKAPNGDTYRSYYCHLRNGRQHDINQAKAMPKPDMTKDKDGNYDRPYRYYLFARLALTPELEKLWGTEADVIPVKVGDTVAAGQKIARAGNTGYGGAGWGLDNAGKPTDPKGGNVHLHLYMAVADGKPNSFMLVDPYGVYSDMSSKACYQPGAKRIAPRFFAPFLLAFHNLAGAVFTEHSDYYPGMGAGLQTISFYPVGNGRQVAGAYDWDQPAEPTPTLDASRAVLTQHFKDNTAKGLRPRQVSVSTVGGAPFYSVLWQKSEGEFYFFVDLDTAAAVAKWKELVEGKHLVIEDLCSYIVDGKVLYAIIYVKPKTAGAFYSFVDMTQATFQAKFNDLSAKGLHLTSISAVETSAGSRFSAVWRAGGGQWVAFDLDAATYQTKFDELAGQGYWLHKVQGYANGKRFAAIWNG